MEPPKDYHIDQPPSRQDDHLPKGRLLLMALLIAGLLGVFIYFSARFGQPSPFQPKLLFWHDDREEAFNKARRQNLPILVVFTQPNCLPCMQLKSEVLDEPDFESLAKGKVVPLELDISASPLYRQALRDFGGAATPFVALTTPDGSLVDIWTQEQPLAVWLNQAISLYQATGPRRLPPPRPAATQPATDSDLETGPASQPVLRQSTGLGPAGQPF